MRESDLLAQIYQRSVASAPGGPRILIGPGDDCAVVATSAGELFLTVDHLIEGRHFTGPITADHHPAAHSGTPVALVARKAIDRSISDIAAMAGRPIWSLATGALPDDFPQELANQLFHAMHDRARHWHAPLIGGDISATSGPVVLTVTVAGIPASSRGPVLRSTARAGDHVYVTGRIGGSLSSGRHLKFEPRIGDAAWLATNLGDRLHAMIDVSDGVGIDAGRIATASKVGLRLDSRLLPLHTDVIDWRAAITDGEDYELLFTIDPSVTLPERCPDTGTRLTRIGTVIESASPASTILDDKGVESDATTMGWDHGAASVARSTDHGPSPSRKPGQRR